MSDCVLGMWVPSIGGVWPGGVMTTRSKEWNAGAPMWGNSSYKMREKRDIVVNTCVLESKGHIMLLVNIAISSLKGLDGEE